MEKVDKRENIDKKKVEEEEEEEEEEVPPFIFQSHPKHVK